MQEGVLNKLKDDRLRVFVVWTNAYGQDKPDLIREGQKILNDKRSKHYWDPKSEIAWALGKTVKLPRDSPLAYDVYFVFDAEAEWKTETPKAMDWMHRILDDARFLDPKLYLGMVKKELAMLPSPSKN